MRTSQLIAALSVFGLMACNGKSEDSGDPSSSGAEEADADTDTDTDTDTDADADADTDTDTDTDTDADADVFSFEDADADAFVRVDRMGMPAVATALIASKDAYNAADPIDDANLMFAGEIIGSLGVLHDALDDDLSSLGLTPCTVVGDGTGSCVAQGAPLILPDTIQIDPSQPAGFPNGRMPPDPVMDVTLAVVLLDLAVHPVDLLVGVLNPTQNDVPFVEELPYLGAPH